MRREPSAGRVAKPIQHSIEAPSRKGKKLNYK
jgi:hypothetical protein